MYVWPAHAAQLFGQFLSVHNQTLKRTFWLWPACIFNDNVLCTKELAFFRQTKAKLHLTKLEDLAMQLLRLYSPQNVPLPQWAVQTIIVQ